MEERQGGSRSMDGMEEGQGGSQPTDAMDSSGGRSISPLKKTIPFSLLASGKLQEIRIDLKKLLKKVLFDLGARSEPLFTEIDCGDEGVKVSIKLDLGFVEKDLVAIVEGSACMNKLSAEKSSVMIAFKHIHDNCNIRILDFSTKVANSFTEYRTFAFLHESLDGIVNIMNSFESTLTNCNDFALELQCKIHNSKYSDSVSADALIYSNLRDHVLGVIKVFSEKLELSRKIIQEIGIETMKQHRRSTDKLKAVVNKNYVNSVVLTSKDLLHFVLSCFSLETPKYTNGPDGLGLVNATAKFKIPKINGLKFCGKLRIEGKGSCSYDAEEDAAYKSLLFFEESYNVKIIDLNYSDRVEVEQIQITLVRLFDRIVEVSEEINENWYKMDESVEGHRLNLCNRTTSIVNAEVIGDPFFALNSCADGLELLLQKSAQSQESCSTLFDRLREIMCEVTLLKKKLQMF